MPCQRTAGRSEPGHFPLVRRLRWLRVLQYGIAFVNLATSAYLAAFLGSKDASIGGAVPVPIIEAGLTFILTGMSQWVGVHFSGYRKRGWLICFIFLDAFCIGLQIPTIVVLAVAGLPSNCHGVASGMDSDVFGGSGNELAPKYCAIPKSVFWLSLISMALYVYSISVLIRQTVAVSRHMKSLRFENRAAEDTQRLRGSVASHAPSRRGSRLSRNQRGFIDTEVASGATSSNGDHMYTPDYSQTSGSVAGEQPPPYIPDEEPDFVKNSAKN
ncbi:hypothetical protein QQS21_009598 [Conoideocrella luteorostrata]|uniref:Uncharacterized protein n=1 Tax=Conoideocrella luteorostrata TaxID=1105319 RepID=A0AAJ0CHJ7_9HYPO|nr:hypothetical protein QQS21_009598 [Conoideocrella luteorostrata]